MKSFTKLAVLALCLVLICAAAVSWHFIKARATQRKLAEDAQACRALAEQGDANSQAKLGDLYYLGKGVPQDYVQAVEWYRKAADKGNAKAEYGLAYMYQEGRGVQQDRSPAISWDRKAADQGYAKAQYALGYSYHQGWEVPQDYSEALRWYHKAADQGYSQAESDLGYMYFHGDGVPQDYSEALRWYRKAADRGNARAESALGYAYSIGAGVPLDYAQSARWYRKAAKGDEYARRALDAMNIRLSVFSKIVLSVVFLWSIFLLVGSRGSMRKGPHRNLTLAGFLGLLWVVLDVYGNSHIGILVSLSAVNVFFSGKSLVCGIGVAILLSFVSPPRIKVALGVCGMLFIAFNVYSALHYDLWHFATCPRAFYAFNALLIGMAITLAILIRTTREEIQNSQNGIGSETSTA